MFGTSLRQPRLAEDPANLLSLLGMTDRNDFLKDLSDAERSLMGSYDPSASAPCGERNIAVSQFKTPPPEAGVVLFTQKIE